MNLGKERRRYRRQRTVIQAEYRFLDSQEWLPCTIFEMSLHGVALEGKKSFYTGDRIEMKIPFKNEPFIFKAAISNVAGKKAGGRFTAMSDADRLAVQDILDSQVRRVSHEKRQ